MTEELFVSAEEAAEMLGVAVPTLYAYVGRKNIRSQKVPGSRQRRYWLPDVERAAKRGHQRADVEALGLSAATDLTLVTPNGPYYRGESAIVLSATATLEDVAGRLWQVDPNEAFRTTARPPSGQIAAIRRALDGATSSDTMIALLPILEHEDARAFDLSPLGMARSGAEIMRWYAALLAERDAPDDRPLHEQVAKACRRPELADLVRRLLVLAADHGFGAGTYAVRAVASTGVSPYRSVLAGLAITTGRRSNFGRSDSIGRLITELESASDPRQVIMRRLHEGEELPGFQSPPPYSIEDPRAQSLLVEIAKLKGKDAGFKRLSDGLLIIRETTGQSPSFAFANLIVSRMLGLESRHALYILARCAGWVAHSIEQYQAGEINRPTSTYLGSLPGVGPA